MVHCHTTCNHRLCNRDIHNHNTQFCQKIHQLKQIMNMTNGVSETVSPKYLMMHQNVYTVNIYCMYHMLVYFHLHIAQF